jgi:hypothetical protein
MNLSPYSALSAMNLSLYSVWFRAGRRALVYFCRLFKSTVSDGAGVPGSGLVEPAIEGQRWKVEGASDVRLAHRAVDVRLADDHAEGVKVVNSSS